MAENLTPPAIPAGFAEELAEFWAQLPNKTIFFSLLAAWVLLFQWVGSPTFAYVDSPSLFGWMIWKCYLNKADDNDDAHGILIPFVVLALFWWKRREVLALNGRPWAPALAMLGACLFLHVVGYLIQQPRVSAVAFFGGIYALIGVAWGWSWMRATFFPFFLLAFAVPISGAGGPIASFTFHLRLLVTQLVTVFCNVVLAIDVHREGTALFNGAHTYQYEVAAACGGLRSVTAISALCTIYGFVTFHKNWKRLLMMASAIPLAILGNTLRLLAIVLAAEMGGQAQGQSVHDNSVISLLSYVPAIIGIVLMARWLQEEPAEAPPPLNPTPA